MVTAPTALKRLSSLGGYGAHSERRGSFLSRLYCTWFPVVMVLVGVAVRARQYFYNRSLWPDEIAVAEDIIRRSYGQLLHVTPNGQAAPIGWFWAERLSTQVFGVDELSLRLVPFLASLLAMIMFPFVGRRLIGRWGMPIALALFAISPQIIYYSSEVKQYGSDITCALLIIAVTIHVYERPPMLRPVVLWAVSAACIVWFSQPGILIVAGCGVVLLVRWARQPRGVWWTVAAGTLPLGVVIVDYFSVLRQQSKSNLLQTYWVAGYPPKPFGLIRTVRWLYHDVADLLSDPGRLNHPDLVFVLGAVGLAVLGSRRLWRWTTVVLVMPLVLAVVVALVRIYPLRERLGLYLLPFIFLLMAAGLRLLDDTFAPRLRLGGQRVAAVGLVAAIAATSYSGMWRGVTIFYRPLDHTAGRQSVAFIVRHIQPGDVIYREDPWATVSWNYYSQHHSLPTPGNFMYVASPSGCASVPGVSQLPVGERVWVFFDSRGSDEPTDAEAVFLSYFVSVGHLVMHYSLRGADGGAYLFQITGSGPPPRPSWIPDGCLRLTGP